MKRSSIVCAVVALSYLTLTNGRSLNDDPSLPRQFDREEQLSDTVRVKWHVDLDAENVTFTVTSQTTGWVGFGISKDALTADTYIGGVNPDGTTYFTDRNSPSVGLPIIDAHQDAFLLEATEDATSTTMTFWRKIDTGDDKEDEKILDAVVFLIYALGETDDIEYHMTEKGFFEANILSPYGLTTASAPLESTTPGYDEIDFTRTEALSSSVSVTWHVYFTIEKIVFEVHAKTTGYVGFGISDTADMTNADMIIGGILEDEMPYFSDRHSIGHGEPIIDASQDWDLLEALETANQTYLRFIREFSTDDYKEDIEITYRDTYFIWALGSTDDLTMHAARGSYGVNILNSNIRENFNRTEKIGENVTVSWSVHFDTQKVTFEVVANTTGYVGFGFSETGTMENSDMIIGGLTSDLTPYFTDRHSNTHKQPIIDAEQNWMLLAVREQKYQTYLRFIREFNTGDATEDLPILDKQVSFIWALGESDEIEYHQSSGSFAVNILQNV